MNQDEILLVPSRNSILKLIKQHIIYRFGLNKFHIYGGRSQGKSFLLRKVTEELSNNADLYVIDYQFSSTKDLTLNSWLSNIIERLTMKNKYNLEGKNELIFQQTLLRMREEEKSLVLVLDEFQRINHSPDCERIYSFFVNIFNEGHTNFFIIYATLRSYKETINIGSQFFGIPELKKSIYPFNESDLKSLFPDLNEEEIIKIKRKTGGFPHIVNILSRYIEILGFSNIDSILTDIEDIIDCNNFIKVLNPSENEFLSEILNELEFESSTSIFDLQQKTRNKIEFNQNLDAFLDLGLLENRGQKILFTSDILKAKLLNRTLSTRNLYPVLDNDQEVKNCFEEYRNISGEKIKRWILSPNNIDKIISIRDNSSEERIGESISSLSNTQSGMIIFGVDKNIVPIISELQKVNLKQTVIKISSGFNIAPELIYTYFRVKNQQIPCLLVKKNQHRITYKDKYYIISNGVLEHVTKVNKEYDNPDIYREMRTGYLFLPSLVRIENDDFETRNIKLDDKIFHLITDKGIRKALDDAWQCYDNDLFNPGVVMLRKAVEGFVALSFKIKNGNLKVLKDDMGKFYNLQKRIKILEGKGLISEYLKKGLINVVLVNGDLGAHDCNTNMKREDFEFAANIFNKSIEHIFRKLNLH